MIIDLHAHSKGVSRCCKATFQDAVDEAKKVGLDGLVLTNHYQKSYLQYQSIDDYIKQYNEEFILARAYAEQQGMRLFYGVEITTELYPKVHMVVYGVGPEFIEENPCVFDLTQQELYEKVKEYGGILIHAHPYRNGVTPLDPKYMDGVEINCHPKYDRTYKEELLSFAEQYDLLVTCGGDFHKDTPRVKCGIFVPDHVSDSIALKDFICSAPSTTLYVQEVGDEECKEIIHTYTDQS